MSEELENQQRAEVRLSKSFGVVKELPDLLKVRKENGERGRWFWATREVVDSEGDLIDVEGIRLDPYHDPEAGVYIKALAQHLKALPDGTAPVVGRVTDHAKVSTAYRRRPVKGLAVYVEWLRDPQTDELLPLAAHYKVMVESGGIDQVSVGIVARDWETMDNGGLHVVECSLYEVSLVTVPANAAATTIKAVKERLGDLLDEDAIVAAKATPAAAEPPPQKQPQKPDETAAAIQSLADAVEKMRGEPDALRGLVEGLAKSLVDLSDKIVERLDVLESAVVVLAQPAATSGGDDRNEKSATKSLKALNATLGEVLRTLNP